MKRSLQSEIRHYDKEMALYRHYKKNSCPSADLKERRNSYGQDEKKIKLLKEREKIRKGCLKKGEKDDGRISSQDYYYDENDDVIDDKKHDVMFSSLDETKLERINNNNNDLSPTPGFQRRTYVIVCKLYEDYHYLTRR